MEILFLFLLFFLRPNHIKGFSHSKIPHWNSLFILAEQEDLDVYVDGCPTGLKAPCQLYFEPQKSYAKVELRRGQCSFFYKNLQIQGPKTYLVGDVTPHFKSVLPSP